MHVTKQNDSVFQWVGTLRVLADASRHGFADLAIAFARLRETNFRASNQLLQQLLDDATRRREP